MNSKSIFLFIGTVLLFISVTMSAQKVFQVHFKFPIGLDTKKVKIFYNNGKEWKKLKDAFVNNEVTIADSLYSRFATISCMYYATEEKSSFSSSFFVWDAPATIIVNENKDTLANLFSDCKPTNAFDIAKTEEAKRFKLFTSVESNDYAGFLKKFGDEISGNDSFIAIRKVKYNKLLNKELDYIRQNGSEYYSLWLFKNELLSMDDFLSPDSLLKVFDMTFTHDFKSAFEGKQIESILRGKVNIAGNNYAPYFKSVDIQDKIVDLNNFKGKYVLLSFWASWCAPCIAELGIIKNLNDEYGKKKLVVISVSIDRDKQPFLKAVKKYKMNWTNIFNDIEIESIFLKKGGIPQVYLIDPNGELIYNRQKEKDYDLYKLKKILKEGK